MSKTIDYASVTNERGLGAWLLRRITGGPEWLRVQRRTPAQLVLANLAWLAGVGIGLWAGIAANIPPARALLLSIGIGTAYLALRKPWWFWQHPDLYALREKLGDAVVWSLYLVISVAALLGSMVRL